MAEKTRFGLQEVPIFPDFFLLNKFELLISNGPKSFSYWNSKEISKIFNLLLVLSIPLDRLNTKIADFFFKFL